MNSNAIWMRKIFAVIGKSCAGKDTLLKEIQKETSNLSNLPIIISYTTRPARQGEVDGKDYKFISDEKFLNMAINKKFADFSSYSVVQDFIWYYGLSKEDLEKRTQLSGTLIKKLDAMGVLEGLQDLNQLSLF